MDGLPPSKLTGAQKEELMDQVKQQIAVANAQELLQKMTEKCFKKCISKPGTSLDNSEQKCISMCMDRYMDSWNIVSRSYGSRIARERGQMWHLAYGARFRNLWSLQLGALHHTCCSSTEGCNQLLYITYAWDSLELVDKTAGLAFDRFAWLNGQIAPLYIQPAQSLFLQACAAESKMPKLMEITIESWPWAVKRTTGFSANTATIHYKQVTCLSSSYFHCTYHQLAFYLAQFLFQN